MQQLRPDRDHGRDDIQRYWADGEYELQLSGTGDGCRGEFEPVLERGQHDTQAPDTQPPTAPTNLTATAVSGSQINLSWTASTDNVGVTGYLVERCQGTGCNSFAQIGTTTGTTYNDTGLTTGTSYSYRVRATDAAGNLSPYSNVASATTRPDTQPPTAPTNLTATCGQRKPDQSELDGIDGQRGSDGIPGGALPGDGMQQLRTNRNYGGDDVQRYNSDGKHQL